MLVNKTLTLRTVICYFTVFLFTTIAIVSADEKGKSDSGSDVDAVKIVTPKEKKRIRHEAMKIVKMDVANDPSFERHVDLKLLGRAWTRLDSATMADCALQFANTESILFRSHKGIQANELLNIAIRLAAEKNDKASLQRIADATAVLGKDKISQKAKLAAQVAGNSRDDAAVMKVDIAETSPEQVEVIQKFMGEISRSVVGNETEKLARISKDLTYTILPDQVQKQIAKLAMAKTSANASDELGVAAKLDAIAKVTGESVTSDPLSSLSHPSRDQFSGAGQVPVVDSRGNVIYNQQATTSPQGFSGTRPTNPPAGVQPARFAPAPGTNTGYPAAPVRGIGGPRPPASGGMPPRNSVSPQPVQGIGGSRPPSFRQQPGRSPASSIDGQWFALPTDPDEDTDDWAYMVFDISGQTCMVRVFGFDNRRLGTEELNLQTRGNGIYQLSGPSVDEAIEINWDIPGKQFRFVGPHGDGITMMRLASGSLVSVLWRDDWYSANILSYNPGRSTVRVHFIGYDNKWDDEVPLTDVLFGVE